jgi:hypothetical protein
MVGSLKSDSKIGGPDQVMIFGVGWDPGDGFSQEVNLGGIGDPRRSRDYDLLPETQEGGENQGLAAWPRYDLFGSHIQVEGSAIMFSDGFSQLGKPRRGKVAPLLDVGAEGLGYLGMHRKPGFPKGEMVHVLALCPKLLHSVVDGESGGHFETPNAGS